MKNRLIGALVLLAVALLMAFLLPKPGHVERDEGLRRVTIDLDGGPQEPVVEGDRVTPPVIAAPDPALEDPLAGESAAVVDGEPEGAEAGMDSDSRMAAAPVSIRSSDSLEQAAPGRVLPAPVAKAPPVQLKQDDSLHHLPDVPAQARAEAPAPSRRAMPPPVAAAAAPAAPTVAAKPVPSLPPPAAPAKPLSKPEVAQVPKPVEPAPVAKPKPAPKPEIAAAKPVEPPKPGPVAGKERWSVQVGSFAEIGNARTAESKLKSAGLPTQFGPVDTAKGVLYRVRVAPLADEAAAKAAKAKAEQLGFAQATVRKD
ncbi:SPOR domain-containing protein [Solimonas sp. K1W22B-7]|nr:SPOR domain-containing protein [Solimonas sp. K1W22B-7]